MELFSRISFMYFHPYAAIPSAQNASRMSEIFVCWEGSPRRLTCEGRGTGAKGGGAVIAWAGHGLMSREGKRTHLKFPALALPNREGRITPPVIGTGREKDLFTRFSCIRRRGQRCAFRGAARALGGCHITRLARRCRLLPANQRGEELVPGKEGQVRVS